MTTTELIQMPRTPTLIFLSPQQYRPLKLNFAKRFENFAGVFHGYIFTMSGERYRGLRIGDFLLYSEVVESSSLRGLLRRLWLQALLALKVVRHEAQVAAVVTYDPYASGIAGALLSTLLGARLIVEVNGDFHASDPSRQFTKKWIMRLARSISLWYADAIKVVNRDQEKFFRQRYPSKKIFRFPNFVASEYFKSLDCHQGDYLLSIGYPYDLKGMDILIRAFQLISDRHPGIRLKIMGYCPKDELVRYRELAAGHPAIEFIGPGWVEDVGEMIRGCYALVNAARSDALPRVHLEAMACKKPIVTSRTNGGMESVEHGETGLLCAIGSAEDLALQLDHILSDPGLAARMGQAGFRRLQTLFSEEIHTRSFAAMIGEVLSARPTRRRVYHEHPASD